MKCLTLFLHAAVRNDVVDALRATDEVTGFTLVECQGHSTRSGEDPFLAARDRVEGFVPRLRIDLVLEDAAVQPVLERVRGQLEGSEAHGTWLVSDVEGFGRL